MLINIGHTVFSFLNILMFENGSVGCPETSVRNFDSAPCNTPEEHRFHSMIYDAGHSLAPHGPVQSNLAWRGPLWHFLVNLR